jgi:hypothetical protein
VVAAVAPESLRPKVDAKGGQPGPTGSSNSFRKNGWFSRSSHGLGGSFDLRLAFGIGWASTSMASSSSEDDDEVDPVELYPGFSCDAAVSQTTKKSKQSSVELKRSRTEKLT